MWAVFIMFKLHLIHLRTSVLSDFLVNSRKCHFIVHDMGRDAKSCEGAKNMEKGRNE